MPFYTKLKIDDQRDKASDIIKKIRVRDNLKNLKVALSEHLKNNRKNLDSNKTVKIATWNLREFGGKKFKGRDFEPIYYIAEIISNFDIVALQEVKSDLKEFGSLKRILGPNWSYLATDVTDGYAGNGERMIFLYNRRKVQFRNIAGELTLEEGTKIKAAFGERIKLENGFKLKINQNINLSGTYPARLKKDKNGNKKLDLDLEIPLPSGGSIDIPDGSSLVVSKGHIVESPKRGNAKVKIPQGEISGAPFKIRFPENSFDDSLRQFARTPFLISFQSGWLKLNLCTVHIYYGDASDKNKLEQRRSEIKLLTKALSNKAKGEFKDDEESFLGVLGDFNIIGKDHPTMEALESNRFFIPKELKSIPGTNVKKDKAYDQIAFWKPTRTFGYSRLDVIGSGVFDFFEHVYKLDIDDQIYRKEENNGLKKTTSYKDWRTYKMSDHLPMWIELRTDFSDEYLDKIDS